jgi:hypothetical protein
VGAASPHRPARTGTGEAHRPALQLRQPLPAQVRVDHLLLGSEVATLDPLGEAHLFGRAQQPVAAELGEEELDPAFRPGGGELRELLLRRHFSSDAPAWPGRR